MSIALFVCEVSINIRGDEKAINKGEMGLMDEIVGGTIGHKQWRDVRKNNSGRRGRSISEFRSERRAEIRRRLLWPCVKIPCVYLAILSRVSRTAIFAGYNRTADTYLRDRVSA